MKLVPLGVIYLIWSWMFLIFFSKASDCGCVIAAGTNGKVHAIDIPSCKTVEIYEMASGFANLARNPNKAGGMWSMSNGIFYQLDICKANSPLEALYATEVTSAIAYDNDFDYIYFTNPGSRTLSQLSLFSQLTIRAGWKVPNVNITSMLYDEDQQILYSTDKNIYKQLYLTNSGVSLFSAAQAADPFHGMDYWRCSGQTKRNLLVLLNSTTIVNFDVSSRQMASICSHNLGALVGGIATFDKPCCSICSNGLLTCAPISPPTKTPIAPPTSYSTKIPTSQPIMVPTSPPAITPTSMTPTSPPAITPASPPAITPTPTTNPTKLPVRYSTTTPTQTNIPTQKPTVLVFTSSPTFVSSSSPPTWTLQDLMTTTTEVIHSEGQKMKSLSQFAKIPGVMLWGGIGAGTTVLLCVLAIIFFQMRRKRQQKVQLKIMPSNSSMETERRITPKSKSTINNPVRKSATESFGCTPCGDVPFQDMDYKTQQMVQSIALAEQKTRGETMTLPEAPTFSAPRTRGESKEEDSREGNSKEGDPKESDIELIFMKDNEEEAEEEEEGNNGTKTQDDQLYELLKETKLLKYYPKMCASDWTFAALLDAYDGTSNSLEALKTIFAREWQMPLRERIRLSDAIKSKKQKIQEGTDSVNFAPTTEPTTSGS